MIKRSEATNFCRQAMASLLITALTASFALPREAEAAPKGKKQKQAQALAKKAAESAPRGNSKSLDIQRQKTVLPQSQKLTPSQSSRALSVVKPPRSGDFYDTGSKEAEYEKTVDEGIRALYKLSQENRRSQTRGELWLRLGEYYSEKARLVDFRAQNEYDKRLREFLEKKTKIRPKPVESNAREYNQKAVQLYEWFIKDFPKDSKVDQALFFLGYNHFELGNPKLGEQFYKDLVSQFPESAYVTESHFALGEYYFENEQWQGALDSYVKVIKVKRARLNTFALYKASWCLYRLNRTKNALNFLERVVRLSRAADGNDNVAGRKAVNKIRLAVEALKDYVPFYAENGDPKDAVREFTRVAGDEAEGLKMAERLAFILADNGNLTGANYLFKQLISINPSGERAAEYQHQVVLAYATSDQKEFRKELELWLDAFGPESIWARDNAGNQKLVTDVMKLQETTVRNHVLQMHQEAQTSRAPFSQKLARAGYVQYLKHFSNMPQAGEMQFFFAELLFEMGEYEEAARVYSVVADRDPKGPYREKAIVNSLLALERALPDSKTIDEKRGTSTEPIPLDPQVEKFEKAALRYMEAFPKGEKVADIQRRLGVLYYSYNHFDKAIDVFEKIIRENPKSENAEIAGNLILDIFKLKNDMIGFAEKGQQLLANPAIARTKFGEQIKGMMENASYIRADKIAESGDTLKAAKEFEAFAGNYKQSSLSTPARYKAAVNYEKSGDLVSASRMYGLVLLAPASDAKIKTVQNDSRIALARLYQETGQLDLAAKQYGQYADANPSDPKSVNAYYNAGVLWESLGETQEAVRSYTAYFKVNKKLERAEVLFTQAKMFDRKGQLSQASSHYDQYLRAGPRNEAHAIEAAFRIAQIADRQGRNLVAKQWYQKTIAFYKAATKGKAGGVKFAAESRFQLAQETFQQIAAIRFSASDRQQAQAAVQIKTLRDRYIGEMKEVIRYDSASSIVAALASSGLMFDTIAQAFAKIPAPAGFSPQDAQKYKELLQGQINGFRNEAKNSYKAAVEKSQELEVYDSWSKLAQTGLTAIETGVSGDASEIPSDANAADWMGL